jgi:uncharacterized protein YcbK (DUF882 family)
METDRITANFRYSEFTKSDTAARLHINNAITSWEVRDNIKALVDDVLQPLRDAWGGPLFINSGYRCLELNKAVGGVPTSQHVLGQACDVGCTDPLALARLAKKMKLDYDQMGVYASFVHFSYKKEGGNRNQIFYAKNYKGPKNI